MYTLLDFREMQCEDENVKLKLTSKMGVGGKE